MLSCSCYEWDGEGTWYVEPEDYTHFSGKRATRCSSCDSLIKPGETVIEFKIYRGPVSEVEVKIYGEYGQINLAPKRMCERCADLYFSITELGYCVEPTDNMERELGTYREMVLFQKRQQ